MTAGESSTLSGRPEVLDGPFTTPQLLRLDEALRLADQSTGLTFSVYVGDLDEPPREAAEKLHSQLPDPDNSVLVAVSPNQRVLEIVTGALARRRIPDRSAKLAALSMAAAFSGGDLAGGIVAGLAQLTVQLLGVAVVRLVEVTHVDAEGQSGGLVGEAQRLGQPQQLRRRERPVEYVRAATVRRAFTSCHLRLPSHRAPPSRWERRPPVPEPARAAARRPGDGRPRRSRPPWYQPIRRARRRGTTRGRT